MERNTKESPGSLPAFVFVLAPALVIVVLGLGALLLTSGGSEKPAASTVPSGSTDTAMAVAGQPMPDYVMASDTGVQMAYQFAVDRPDVMMWMVCYCGCGDHSGHKSALNCFIKDGGKAFDSHGSNCDVCVSIALDAKAMTEEGRSLKDIRSYIDSKYSYIGPGTNTPLPPA